MSRAQREQSYGHCTGTKLSLSSHRISSVERVTCRRVGWMPLLQLRLHGMDGLAQSFRVTSIY